MVAWMEQRLRQITMIGQQHEPFTIEIQPPDGENPHRHPVQEILHGWTAFGVVKSRHNIFGLVKDQIDKGLSGPQVFAVYLDVIPVGIHLGAKFFHHMAVDGHTTGGDQLFGLSSRSKPGPGYEFL